MRLCRNRRTWGVVLLVLAAALPAVAREHQTATPACETAARQYAETARTSYAAAYEIIAIDPLVTWDFAATQAYAVNNAGQVLGNYSTPDYICYTAALWENGVLTTIDSAASQLGGMNEQGDVVGTRSIVFSPTGGVYRAIMWYDGQEIDLQVSDDTYSFAHDVNNFREVVGYYKTAAQYAPSYKGKQGYIWRDGDVTALPGLVAPLPGVDGSLPGWDGPEMYPHAINNAGQIAGHASYVIVCDPEDPTPEDPNDFDIRLCAVRWEQVGGEWQVTPLGPLGKHERSFALAINEAGDVAGSLRVNPTAEVNYPVLFRLDGTVTILCEIKGGAFGINNRGDAVGTYHVPGNTCNEGAFLWSNGVFTDLRDLLSPADQADWELWQARDINDDGWIVGIGWYRGEQRGFILRPRPDSTDTSASTACRSEWYSEGKHDNRGTGAVNIAETVESDHVTCDMSAPFHMLNPIPASRAGWTKLRVGCGRHCDCDWLSAVAPVVSPSLSALFPNSRTPHV